MTISPAQYRENAFSQAKRSGELDRKTAEHVMRKDVILAKARNGLKERPVAILGYLLTAGNATVAECEEELKMNRRTL